MEDLICLLATVRTLKPHSGLCVHYVYYTVSYKVCIGLYAQKTVASTVHLLALTKVFLVNQDTPTDFFMISRR